MSRTCQCGGVIREYGKAYHDILPSCTCHSPIAIQSSYTTNITTTGTRPMSKDNTLDEYFHYQRVCEFCGHAWFGLHCPHDGYQNPCPKCDVLPITNTQGECACELVAPISAIKSLIAEERRKAKVEELKFMKTGDKTVTQYAEGGEIITYVFSAQEINDRLSRLEQEDE